MTSPSTSTQGKSRLFMSTRFGIMVLGCIGVGIMGGNFSTLHFSWTCMVNTTAAAIVSEGFNLNSTYPENPYGGNLEWGKDVQEVVFSAYAIGAMLLLLPAGTLTERFGAKIVFGVCLLLVAGVTVLIPVAAIYTQNVWSVFVLRMFVGLAGAGVWSMIYSTSSFWVPANERGIAMALFTSGFPFGIGITNLLSGLECTYLGWPSIFYISGGATLIFSIIWFTLYSNEPESSRFISEAELEYIVTTRTRKKMERKIKIPWKGILTSPAVWAAMIGRGSGIYLSFVTVQFMPSYLKEVFLLDPSQNGLYSSLPLMLQLVGRWIAGFMSEQKFSTVTGRIKIISAITLFGGGVSALGQALNTLYIHDLVLATILFCLINFFASFQTGGYTKSPLYIAPQFSSVVGSLVSLSGYVFQITVPFVVGGLTSHISNFNWSLVFFISFAFSIVGGVFFCIFGSGEVQHWADVATNDPIGSLYNSKSSTVTLVRNHGKLSTVSFPPLDEVNERMVEEDYDSEEMEINKVEIDNCDNMNGFVSR